jgi:hypothetical protein
MMMKRLMTQIPLLHIENEEEHSHDRSMEETIIYTWQEIWIQGSLDSDYWDNNATSTTCQWQWKRANFNSIENQSNISTIKR